MESDDARNIVTKNDYLLFFILNICFQRETVFLRTDVSFQDDYLLLLKAFEIHWKYS